MSASENHIEGQVVRIEPPAPPSAGALTPMDMLRVAVERGSDMSVVEKLMDLQERWEATQARKAFNEAIALAKGRIKPIIKSREVDFTTNRGRTNYKFEDFAQIASQVDPVLNDLGLSYRFRAEQNGKRLRVICVLSHRDGYFEETSLEASEDESGNKNAIQAIGSAATYLQRYTLKLALGLASAHDDDGQATANRTTPGGNGASKITEEQYQAITDLVAQTGTVWQDFCAHMKVKTVTELTQAQADLGITLLKRKLAKQGAH